MFSRTYATARTQQHDPGRHRWSRALTRHRRERPRPPPRRVSVPAATTSAIGPEQVTGAQSIVRSLEEAGVEVVFGIPGGAILPTYDPLMDSTRVRHILVRHEQGGGHAAAGYAAATGRVGVCMATSGPGATNLVTPIADAHMDSVPLVAITGQVVASHDRDRRVPGGRHRRHHAAGDQAQLPGHRPGRHPARDRRGVPHRVDRSPRPGARRHREVRDAGRAPRSPGRRS